MIRVLWATEINSYGTVEACWVYEFTDYNQLGASVRNARAMCRGRVYFMDNDKGIVNALKVHDCTIVTDKPLYGWQRAWVCEGGKPSKEVVA